MMKFILEILALAFVTFKPKKHDTIENPDLLFLSLKECSDVSTNMIVFTSLPYFMSLFTLPVF